MIFISTLYSSSQICTCPHRFLHIQESFFRAEIDLLAVHTCHLGLPLYIHKNGHQIKLCLSLYPRNRSSDHLIIGAVLHLRSQISDRLELDLRTDPFRCLIKGFFTYWWLSTR